MANKLRVGANVRAEAARKDRTRERPFLAYGARLAGSIWLTIALLCLEPSDVSAHPHVFVDAKVEIAFDVEGRIAAVRNLWQFDSAFSEYAVQGLDADQDGSYSRDELAPLADTNVESLQEFGYFTYLTMNNQTLPLGSAEDHWLEWRDDRLTLRYTLPLSEPRFVDSAVLLEIFDAQYFVAFEFAEENPVALTDAPGDCSAALSRPGEPDDQMIQILGQVPVDQRTLPPDLAEAVKGLANHVEISCEHDRQATGPTNAQPTTAASPDDGTFPLGRTFAVVLAIAAILVLAAAVVMTRRRV